MRSKRLPFLLSLLLLVSCNTEINVSSTGKDSSLTSPSATSSFLTTREETTSSLLSTPVPETTQTTSSSLSTSSPVQTELKSKLNALKSSHHFHLDIVNTLKTSQDATQNHFVYDYSETAIQKTYYDQNDEVEEVSGLSSSEEGIYTYSIVKDVLTPGPVLDINTKNVWEENAGIRNYYDGLNVRFVQETETTHHFQNDDAINLNAVLNMAEITPNDGLTNLVEEFTVSIDKEDIVFLLDFGVSGTLEERISHINEESYKLSEIETYEKNGGKPRQPEEGLLSILSLFKNHNYSVNLTANNSQGETVSIGTRYYSENYIYDDYSSDYLQNHASVTRRGYVYLENNPNAEDGVYSFTPLYDEKGNAYLNTSCLTQSARKQKLTEVFPYFENLLFNQYLSSFYSGKDYIFDVDGYYTLRSDLASNFNRNIFSTSSTPTQLVIAKEEKGDGSHVYFEMVTSDNLLYMMEVYNFSKTKIDFIENYR